MSENALEYRVPPGPVVTLSTTTNQMYRREQRYNFIDYHFEVDGVYLVARAYLDEIEAAAVFGPLERRGSIKKVDAPNATDAVLAYLRRRFRAVQQLQATAPWVENGSSSVCRTYHRT